MTLQVVKRQPGYKTKFKNEISLGDIVPEIKEEQPGPENKSEYCRGPGDAVPQPAFHYLKLFNEDTAFRFGFVLRLAVVNKKAHNVKQSSEPGHDKNNVQCENISHRITN